MLLLAAFSTFGQIQRSAYRIMLKSLLSHSVPEIGIQDAASKANEFVFLDARESKEYKISHIQNALEIGYDHFDIQSVKHLTSNTPIIVYCSVGYRSEKIAEKLIQAGYSKVFNLYGGIFEWVNQDNAVYNEKGPTNEIHGYNSTWGIWVRKGKKRYD